MAATASADGGGIDGDVECERRRADVEPPPELPGDFLRLGVVLLEEDEE